MYPSNPPETLLFQENRRSGRNLRRVPPSPPDIPENPTHSSCIGLPPRSFILFAQSQTAWTDAWNTIIPLLQSGAIKPIAAKTFPMAEAAEALRYLVEGRPFGGGVLTI